MPGAGTLPRSGSGTHALPLVAALEFVTELIGIRITGAQCLPARTARPGNLNCEMSDKATQPVVTLSSPLLTTLCQNRRASYGRSLTSRAQN